MTLEDNLMVRFLIFIIGSFSAIVIFWLLSDPFDTVQGLVNTPYPIMTDAINMIISGTSGFIVIIIGLALAKKQRRMF